MATKENFFLFYRFPFERIFQNAFYLFITGKFLNQGFRYHKLLTTFTKYFHRYKDLVLKFGCTCRKLISNGIAHPHFYGNVVNRERKFRKLNLSSFKYIYSKRFPNQHCNKIIEYCFYWYTY